jgi:Transposase
VPDEDRPGRRLQEVETYTAMTRPLLSMADRLRCLGVTRVVMEATSDYWKPVFYLLESRGFEAWLVNARDVKHLPGRGKSDRQDCVWLCKLNERGRLHRIGSRSSVRACRRRSGSRPGLTPQLAVRCGGSPGRFSSGDAASRRLVPSTRRCRRSRSAGPARRRRRTGRPRAAAGRSIAPSRRSAR